MCAQMPSKFHDPTDRVVLSGECWSTGKTSDYVRAKGIDPAKVARDYP